MATVAFLLLIPVCSPGLPEAAAGTEELQQTERQVILLIVDRLSYPQLRSSAGPLLSSLLSRGAVALLNVRAGASGSESGYLSIGSAARAVAGSEGGHAYQQGEIADGRSAEKIFYRHTGRLPGGKLFHLQLPLLHRNNESLNYPVPIGYLGSKLAEEGLLAAVAGNADTTVPGRSAVMIAMDKYGEVPLGEVGESILFDDPAFPFGKRTEIDKLAASVAGLMERADLVVVEFGDLTRLDQYWTQLDPSRQAALLAETMSQLDRLLGQLLALFDQNTVLMIVAPSPPRHIPGGSEHLTPFLVFGAPLPPGLAVSTATRRPGLLLNTDLAPAIISLLEGEAAGVLFLDQAGGEAAGTLQFLDSFYDRTTRIFRLRPPLIRGYIIALIVFLLAAFGWLLLRLPLVEKLFIFLEAVSLFPLTMLLLAWWQSFPFESVYLSGAILVAANILLFLLLQPIKTWGRSLYWGALGMLTALVVTGDALTGAVLQQSSLLSYDPIVGARFYGVGNEYMGVLVGAAILGTTVLAGEVVRAARFQARFYGLGSNTIILAAVLLFYLLIIFIFASPGSGANLGGTVTAAVAFSVAFSGLWRLSGGQSRSLLVTSCFFIFALGLLWLLNFRLFDALPSHVGNFGRMVLVRGEEVVWETVQRKMSMNWRLIRHSVWSRAFVISLGMLVVFCFYPIGVLKNLYKKEPFLLTGATAAAAGSLTALVANDSGVVAAATMLLFAVPPLLFAVIGEVVKSQPDDRGKAG